MKRIAVVGSGISGLAAAYFLSRRHEVTLFEREGRLGGHTHTVIADSSAGPVALDTGFLVHNDRTYPRLVRLFAEIGVATRSSDMCFAVACAGTGLEYSSRGPRGFFAQRRNVISPSHLGLLAEICRFNREAPKLLARSDADRLTLGEFLEGGRFSERFVHRYLLPMASAIWSASLASIRAFPALTMIRFLDNHGLLAMSGQPMWKVVAGGSSTYIPKLAAPLRNRVHTGVALRGIARTDRGVTLHLDGRGGVQFDEVVLACHGDQVLPLLDDPTPAERDVFAGFTTTPNVAWLHTDDSVLPVRASARASWNYRLHDDHDAAPTVTYHLNRLQGLDTAEQFCVTLNPTRGIDERKVIRKIAYRHPLFDHLAIRAQARWPEVSGVRHTHYCGAYWFYGFHEDGLRSALRVASALGVEW
ncbi:MAG TPA: FAD-dependent oxidoreductase [Vicinamibacterales bacterium]|nr:FAD-dependent oxidoreductase [Vicinamibacterales bacterium]